VTLEDGRKLHTGERAEVTDSEAETLGYRGVAVMDEHTPRSPRSCSMRRDHLWKAGIR
jgi:hypothetical protein